MNCKVITLTATAQSLTTLLGIQNELRGGMKVRLQFNAGTILYGSKAAQVMTLTAGTADDLEVNGNDLYLKGPGTVNVLAY